MRSRPEKGILTWSEIKYNSTASPPRARLVDVNGAFIWWFAACKLKLDIFSSPDISVHRIMLKINWGRVTSQIILDNLPDAILVLKATEYIRT